MPLHEKKSFAENSRAAADHKGKSSPNKTGMPDHLKSGLENLSGYNLSHVRVHFNSHQPAQLNALAYAQGSDIHLGPGQEKHLPHESWHVVQQMQGRVQPTTQLKDNTVPVNTDRKLEREADKMGKKAIQKKEDEKSSPCNCGGSDDKKKQGGR
jgi:hypothetical protein